MISFSLRSPIQVDIFDIFIGEFLQFFFTAVFSSSSEIIFSSSNSRRSLMAVTAHVAHGDPAFFQPVVNHLDQITAAFFGQRRQVQANSFAIVVGVSPRSEARIACSIALRVEASKGRISSERGSGTLMLANCTSGVGIP